VKHRQHQNQKRSNFPNLHPKAQLIITGMPLTSAQVADVLIFSEQQRTFQGWCSVDGAIGHLDSMQPNATCDQIHQELEELSRKFNFLELAISIMSGPPGTFTSPLITFHVKKGVVRRDHAGHVGHPPPKRIMQKKG